MTAGTTPRSDRRGFLRVLVGAATTAALLLAPEPAEAEQEELLDGGTPTS